FTVPDASLITKLNLDLLRDDGAIVYLNGSEVLRSNMPVDPITYKTTASSVVDGAAENQFLTATVAANRLTTGTNVLAVEIHQYFKMDEDISFDLKLMAQQSGEPVSYVTGHLYLDANGNGIQDGDESGLANIDIIITDLDKTQTVSTNGNGDWTAMVTAGSVTIDVEQSDPDFPADATQTEGADPNTILASEGETTDGGTDGYHVSLGGAIGDFVWNDANHNGLQDQGEAGVEGVTVTLYNAGGQVGSPQTTDGNGTFAFIGLDPGEYHIQFSTIPAGAVFTLQDANDNNSDAQDSDVDGVGATAVFLLCKDEIKTDIDAGIYVQAPPEPAQASGLIWKDANANGIKDAPEKGVGSVTVNLLTASGAFIGTTTTDRKGLYSFAAISPGDYIIEFVNPNPALFAFTLKDQGSNDAVDSDVNSDGRTDVLAFASGEIKANINAGLADGDDMQSEQGMVLAELPDEYDLLQNFPNPFNPETHIVFKLKQDGDVSLFIYNVQGQIVKILAHGFYAAGVYKVVWKGVNEQDQPLSSGTYLYKLKVNDFTAIRKMAFMR
ncbi:T9SS type A sorting domain-containing protein, partial [candidate division KSB1 bacterium]